MAVPMALPELQCHVIICQHVTVEGITWLAGTWLIVAACSAFRLDSHMIQDGG